MLSKWPIRNKLLTGIALLVIIVATLSATGFIAANRYRSLVVGLERRGLELPMGVQLIQQVYELRRPVNQARENQAQWQLPGDPHDMQILRQQFRFHLADLQVKVRDYGKQLTSMQAEETQIAVSQEELNTLEKIDKSIVRIKELDEKSNWVVDDPDLHALNELDEELATLQKNAKQLPGYLHQRLRALRTEVRGQYRAMNVLVWVSTVLATMMIFLFIKLGYSWVFRPLRVLVKGSRLVAAGKFDHRIQLQSNDEMAELAAAMNDMTTRFQTIRDDLDQQVKVRTRQVARSEQLASVGFLAAGVAHEINNPLASIALCAESLESRVDEVLQHTSPAQVELVRSYLSMIQEEAFRCKDITEKLLDFSRMGDIEKQETDLRQLVQGVIEMVCHLGKYKEKTVDLAQGPNVIAAVNAQQMKQVLLNLITNGLDSIESAGCVEIELRQNGENAEIVISDNGCGMTEEVQEHLFEPFFTRSRTGAGTGLGLSIAYQIVADHDGQIEVHSPGIDRGSVFTVILPIDQPLKEQKNRYQAA